MSAAETLALIAPQYASDPRAAAAVSLARSRAAEDAFVPERYEIAVAYLAAHILTVADRGAAAGGDGMVPAGSIATVTTGGRSVGFVDGGVGGWDADLALQATPYGREYVAMRRASLGSLPSWVR